MKTIYTILILFLLVGNVSALKLPEIYPYGQCELIMKDYQEVYGGNFVLIQPLTKDGAYEFGMYNAHWLNKVYSKERGLYFIEYKSQTYFNTTQEISDWYYELTGKSSKVYDFSIKRPDFGIIWHY